MGSSVRAKRFFRSPNQTEANDVIFDLVELERVPIGESFSVVVTLQVRVRGTQSYLDIQSTRPVLLDDIHGQFTHRTSRINCGQSTPSSRRRPISTTESKPTKFVDRQPLTFSSQWPVRDAFEPSCRAFLCFYTTPSLTRFLLTSLMVESQPFP